MRTNKQKGKTEIILKKQRKETKIFGKDIEIKIEIPKFFCLNINGNVDKGFKLFYFRKSS